MPKLLSLKTALWVGLGILLVGASGVFGIPDFNIAGFSVKGLLLLAGAVGAFIVAFKGG